MQHTAVPPCTLGHLYFLSFHFDSVFNVYWAKDRGSQRPLSGPISYRDTAQTQEKEWQWLRSLIHGIKNVDVLLAQAGERNPLFQHKSLIFNNREYSF